MVTKKKAVKKTAKKTVKQEAVEEIKTPEIPNEEAEIEETSEEVVETPKKEKNKEIGVLKGGKKVYQWINTVRTVSLRGPISKSKLPQDIQRRLTNKWYGTNVYLQPKEWLERHHVNMEMVEKLKKFINDNFL